MSIQTVNCDHLDISFFQYLLYLWPKVVIVYFSEITDQKSLKFKSIDSELNCVKKAPIPNNEIHRQSVLDSLNILDTREESVFDQLTFLASQICGTPISLISLVDKNRQWFKSRHGLNATETARDISFCGHAVFDGKPLIVPDSRNDERFADNPLVTGDPNVIFYAGIPLVYDKENIGTLCVIDSNPKVLSEQQINNLSIIADQVVAQLRLRVELKKSRLQIDSIERFSEQVPGTMYQFQQFADGRSCFPFATQGIREIYEVEPTEIKCDASIVFSRLHPDDLATVSKSIVESAAHLTPWKLEYRVNLPQRGERWLRGFAKPEKLKNESVIWHGFITDITEERKILATLQNNAKLSALGEMAGGIAHEINNPLGIISGQVEILNLVMNQSLPDINKAKRSVQSIEKTVNRIVKIIKGLNAFSRNTEMEAPQNVELSHILEETFSFVTEKFKVYGVNFSYDSGKNLFIKCNSVQISQTLMNLLNNAFDAIKNENQKWIKVAVLQKNESVEIVVTDSGPRIPFDTAKKLMQPFFSTKPIGQGTGLGLSVSRGLIEKHGGKLIYDGSKPNTCFVVELPLQNFEVKKAA